jgi:hypothetical protein
MNNITENGVATITMIYQVYKSTAPENKTKMISKAFY